MAGSEESREMGQKMERCCKRSLYIYSYALLVFAFVMTLSTLVLYLLSYETQVSSDYCGSNDSRVTCGTCVGPSGKGVCAAIVICSVVTLFGFVLWALYLVKRCLTPGYCIYWKSRLPAC